ncbi:MAG: hypothetical protein R6X02_27570 [Enhygromyxa sp.]
MADFLERIEHHLRRVQRIEAAEVVDADRWPDLARHEAMVVELFERIAAKGPREKKWAADKFSCWSRHQLEHFVDEVHWELLAGLGGRAPHATRGDHIDAAIFIASDHIKEVSVSFPLRDRLREIARVARRTVDSSPGEWEWRVVSRYCQRLGMVRERPRAPGLRFPGHTFMRLRGIDRLRWLLALEGIAAVNDRDACCVSAHGVTDLVEHADIWVWDGEVAADRHPRFPHWSTVKRWESLGAIEISSDDDYPEYRYQLTELGRELFGEASQTALDLFRTLAAAEADDIRNEALRRSESPGSASAAARELRYARLVAHEVRNALLPVRFELGKLWKTVDRAWCSPSPTSCATPSRPAVRRSRSRSPSTPTIPPRPLCSSKTTVPASQKLSATRSSPTEYRPARTAPATASLWSAKSSSKTCAAP